MKKFFLNTNCPMNKAALCDEVTMKTELMEFLSFLDVWAAQLLANIFNLSCSCLFIMFMTKTIPSCEKYFRTTDNKTSVLQRGWSMGEREGPPWTGLQFITGQPTRHTNTWTYVHTAA
ncbi:hypothetical protein CHARACLAT_025172 [Characodon lateralis]|uniref:Uncharacterized protein n=1 Tax=Characodon lateralis TaxID=208331 RepID=A0ABU7DJN9_9TELE|nr:hypothetical protein [Characodon lateralis]